VRQYWEDRFSTWAQPPSDSEADRIDNAITAIRKALDANTFLASSTKVYVQGSYRNRVNVRQESDVDVGILYTGNAFYPHYPTGKSHLDFGNVGGAYSFADFKDAVEVALVSRFGRTAVTRGSKAFDVHANSYRVDADVVPTFVHRRYTLDGSYICGVQFFPDAGPAVVNWPERLFDDPRWPDQHYEHGVAKNTATARGFKGVVRILKKLRHELLDASVAAAMPVPGFLVECLVWNVPNAYLRHSSWDDNVQAALAHLWSSTETVDQCSQWGEVSELKYLFRGLPDERRQQVRAFLDAAWSHIGARKIGRS
jgi:hypothetical protein